MALRSQFPEYVSAVTTPLGRGIARTGITPNWLTTFGLLLTAAATWFVANGEPVIGGWVLVAGGLMDTFDGAVARATGRSTPFGGFYDSVSDRISDGLILAGVAWWVRDEPRVFVLAVSALVAAEVTSYVRAKAESIDLTCDIGILERAERAILLMFALVFHRWLLEPVLWLLAVGGVVTVVQRIHHVWCQIDRDIPEELLELAVADRAWSRAFLRAARRFYGEYNFDPALDSAQRAAQETDEVPLPPRSRGDRLPRSTSRSRGPRPRSGSRSSTSEDPR
ncbi:CDP-alcohol phosphatidyltransferase family protein [Egicoccus sp. AB-alg6-2]|uniref:CDP-alcohol phosphatidyltransferase family protein n=1 Tax=Egicoccus sp. AB-alg6-2 TaxID=3242692 RepID=UPI00359DF0C5